MTTGGGGRKRRVVLIVCAALLLAAAVLTLLPSISMFVFAQGKTAGPDGYDGEQYDCIVVLGAGLKPDGSPSDVLYDRVRTAVSLYLAGAAPYILMTGDGKETGYNEPRAMKELAMSMGVPEYAVKCDTLGLNTAASMQRVRKYFDVKKIAVVTQQYHLYRAMWLASRYGLEAEGYDAALRTYVKQSIFNVREFFARIKDYYNIVDILTSSNYNK
ncbi:MAG: YdcF family protein [Clostridia bacterium]|nr:YdcF family protein [Clostridia bacterium]